MGRLFGIIDSMTPQEPPQSEQGDRPAASPPDRHRGRRRAQEVSDLVKQFDGMSAMMKGMAGMGMREPRPADAGYAGADGQSRHAAGEAEGDTGKRLTADERRKQKKQREKEPAASARGVTGGGGVSCPPGSAILPDRLPPDLLPPDRLSFGRPILVPSPF